MGWQPIETAPGWAVVTDGKWWGPGVRLKGPDGRKDEYHAWNSFFASFEGRCLHSTPNTIIATHWMPPPEPPEGNPT